MERKRRFHIGLLLCLFLAICGVTGCNSEEPAAENGKTDAEAGREKEESGGYDFASGSWATGKEVTESEEIWAATDYWGDYMLEIPAVNMRISKRITVVDGSGYYILERYTDWGKTGAGCQKYYLTCLDMSTLEAERKELKLQGATEENREELGELAAELAVELDENWLIITGMSAFDRKLCLLALQMDRTEKIPSHYYIVWLDTEGRMESATDILPQIQQAGMERDNIVPAGIIYDKENYYYVGTENSVSGIGVFDKDGNYLKYVEAPNGADDMIFSTCCLPNGNPVFECTGSDGEKTVIFCLEDLEEKVLYYGDCDAANVRYPGAGGEVLYVGGRGIICWNVETGKRERIYQDTSLDPWSYEAIWKAEDGGVTVASCDGEFTFVQKLQPGAEVTEKKIVLFQLREEQTIKRYADEYSRRHPGIKIEVQRLDTSDGYETAFLRFAAQLVSGEGPDMFLLQRQQLEILQDKGVLAELTQFLPEEILEQIFPVVLEAGSLDETLYGISVECVVNTLAVSESLWQKETWDYPDIISLMEADEASGGELRSVFGDMSSSKLLESLAIMSIGAGKSSLMDEKAGKCYFNTEEFVKLLELCKKYGAESGRNLNDGKSLVYLCPGNLISFSRAMAELGEGYRCVGYPVKGDFGGFVECSYLVGVNKKTENEEIVRDFLQYLLSDRAQRENGFRAVRRDVLSSSVMEHTEFGNGVVYMNAWRGYTELESKPDGSSFLPEYLEILEKGAPLPPWNKDVGGVILEETQAYFNGDKTAEEVAKIIQNRLQLYLDER